MNSPPSYEHLTVNRDGAVVQLVLNTANKGNAMGLQTLRELTDFADSCDDDDSLAAVVLSGRESVFSVGMDLADARVRKPLNYSLRDLRRGAALGAKMCRAWESMAPLTIAAIEGPCVGGGVALSLALDLRVCSRNAQLYVPEIERGMNMSWQSVPRSVNLIGPARTKRMFILAEKLAAEQAFEWGWADYLAEPSSASELALELAQRAASMPPVAARMCKQSINAAANALNHAVSYMDADQLVLTQHSKDYREGIDSFLEKRKPDYRGE